MNIEKLRVLTEAGLKQKTPLRLEKERQAQDRDVPLSSEKTFAWARFLSSIATTESVEHIVLMPLLDFFAGDADLIRYLEGHAEDEQRHHQLLVGYVDRTFQYQKKNRSLSDRVIYDTILPQMAALARKNPLPFLGVLHFYEDFSLSFYHALKRAAKEDGLTQLTELITGIEKDELRHLAGLQILLQERQLRQGVPTFPEELVTRFLLELLRVDIHMGEWALHNRQVRSNLAHLGLSGIDPDLLNTESTRAVKRTLQVLSPSS